MLGRISVVAQGLGVDLTSKRTNSSSRVEVVVLSCDPLTFGSGSWDLASSEWHRGRDLGDLQYAET